MSDSRKSGVLLHISSLPSNYGIGTFGDEARAFVDFLAESHQSYWQILPLCQTSFGDSPYQSFSSYAGNPYFIDLDYLCRDDLIMRDELEGIDFGDREDCVDYDKIYKERYAILHICADNFKENDEYCSFLKNNHWLEEYSLFMALKDHFKGCDWANWPKEYKFRDPDTIREFAEKNAGEIRFWKVVQFLFYKQWFDLKDYANHKGIKIIGDCPIYVAYDSIDVWSRPELFELDDDRKPKRVAGCPPDAFSPVGPRWGNPLYDWKMHKKDGYAWWKDRVSFLCKVYDLLRIDHFRGIEAYYAIPYGDLDARNGEWVKGPDMKLINALKEAVDDEQIIAEDLGDLGEKARLMLKKSNYPGMKVIEFGFGNGNDNEHLPYNIPYNCVTYLGTHDNEPINEWIRNCGPEEYRFAKDIACVDDSLIDFNWRMIGFMMSSICWLTIIQAQRKPQIMWDLDRPLKVRTGRSGARRAVEVWVTPGKSKRS